MKAIIIHGSFGNPQENWFPWLKEELEKLSYQVEVPKFPTPENQSLDSWREVIKNYTIDKDTILIGHSLAPAFILDILEKQKAKACYLISGFLQLLGNETFDSINKTFVNRTFNWEKIKENCKHFTIFHSDNDPYVSVSCAEELANSLDSKVTVIKNAGHFNKDAGYTKFPELLEVIQHGN